MTQEIPVSYVNHITCLFFKPDFRYLYFSLRCAKMSLLQSSVLQELKCTKCSCYLSYGPVTPSSDGYLCGRCPGEESVTIYEALAQNCLFPCRYNQFGCQEVLPFGQQVKQHELICKNKPYFCPNVPLEHCEWQGPYSGMLEHFKERHPHLVLNPPLVELSLTGKTEIRYLYPTMVGLYLVDLVYYEEKGLSVEVTAVGEGVERYNIVLRSSKQPGVLTLPRSVGYYTANSSFLKISQELIDTKMLQYLGGDKITVDIELKRSPSVCNLCKAAVCCCSLESVHNGMGEAGKYVFQACKHRSFGCTYMSYLPDVLSHEESCVLHDCPLKSEDCNWKGKLDEVSSHVSKQHQVFENQLALDFADLLKLEEPKFYVLKSTHGLFRVCIKLEHDRRLMYAAVQYLGDSSLADKCVFNVKFFTDGTTNRKSFVCAPLVPDDASFDYCAHFSYERLKDSKVIFTVRKKSA